MYKHHKGEGNMKAYIEERVLGIAAYILETGATVRSAARKFKISKSTVHKDVTERLTELNPTLARQVRQEHAGASYPRRRGHAAAVFPGSVTQMSGRRAHLIGPRPCTTWARALPR